MKTENADINSRLDAIDERFDEVLGAMSQFAESVDKRFDQIDGQFEQIDMRLFNIENDITTISDDVIDLKKSHAKLLDTVDALIARIDKYETEQAARDREIERMKRWIQQIADKTGVELTS